MQIQDYLKKKWVIALSILFLTLSMCSAITHEYGPHYGKVVDAETKEPIDGAAVLAIYFTTSYGSPSGLSTRFVETQETLTNKNGEFIIPSIRIFTYRLLSGWEEYPRVQIFKPEYGCYSKHKGVKPMFVPNGSLPYDQYVTIELPRLRTKEERRWNSHCSIPSVPSRKMPIFRRALNIERVNLGFDPEN